MMESKRKQAECEHREKESYNQALIDVFEKVRVHYYITVDDVFAITNRLHKD